MSTLEICRKAKALPYAGLSQLPLFKTFLFMNTEATVNHASSGAGGEVLVLLYQNFIIHFETKINLLKVAYIVDRVCQRYPEEEAAISFLEG
nr:26S proteasome non-ATPase regulatory subunit 13 homolog B [Tanacetum cinerariifolium]